jgi:uncharacterized membrane protein
MTEPTSQGTRSFFGRPVTPDDMRLIVSKVLTVGIIVSAAFLVVGFVGALFVGWGGSLLGKEAIPAQLTDFGAMGSGLAALRPAAIGQLGLIALVLTPVSRVAASILIFALEHDRAYVVITTAVLVILLSSLLFIR